jgi:hypothetical protein
MTVVENIAHAKAYIATSEALVADSRALRSEALWTRLRAQDARGARHLSGASDDDAGRIASLILGRTLCGPCLAEKAGVGSSRVDDVLVRIGHTVQSRLSFGTCEACEKVTVVHRIG